MEGDSLGIGDANENLTTDPNTRIISFGGCGRNRNDHSYLPRQGSMKALFFFPTATRPLPSEPLRDALSLPFPCHCHCHCPLPSLPPCHGAPSLSKSLGAHSPSALVSFPLLDLVPQKGSGLYSEVVQYQDNPWLGRGKPLILQPSSKKSV